MQDTEAGDLAWYTLCAQSVSVLLTSSRGMQTFVRTLQVAQQWAGVHKRKASAYVHATHYGVRHASVKPTAPEDPRTGREFPITSTVN